LVTDLSRTYGALFRSCKDMTKEGSISVRSFLEWLGLAKARVFHTGA